MSQQAFPNFSKGELAPVLYGRQDISPYSAAVRKARNMLIIKQGGLTMRPGFLFISEVYDQDSAVRLLPFQFDDGKSSQNYALEMGQAYMRPMLDGGMVLEELLTVTGITNANPARVTIPFHGYEIGDDWAVSGILGMPEINDRIFRITTIVDANTFEIDADSTGWGTFTGDSPGGITRVAPPDPQPAPPVVPPVVPPPPPPPVVGGGGGTGSGGGSGGGGVREPYNTYVQSV